MVKRNFFPVALLCFSLYMFSNEIEPPCITVWIHGTQPKELLPSFPVRAIAAEWNYFQNFKEGLGPIIDALEIPCVQMIARCVSDCSRELFPYEHWYQFGWSGRVSVARRKQAAHDLYRSLKSVANDYKERYGVDPLIRLVSHSHGGNVVLHMHEWFEKDSDPLFIDQIILLACPIQTETALFVESPLFKSVLNIYSPSDVFQVVDPQWLQPFTMGQSVLDAWNQSQQKPWFSGRLFVTQAPHITQICVRWKSGAPWNECQNYVPLSKISYFKTMSDCSDFFKKNRGLTHVQFQLPLFLKRIPEIVALARNVKDLGLTSLTLADQLVCSFL